ncbi:MAG: serine/threonine protein kinase [Myxococcales bacterium]|nr:serine/threonine protein kinase [Myxococcales bacterium]
MRDPQAATERVGRYQLLEPIGSGPNGSVSRAKVFGVAGFERQFAVKRFVSDVTTTPALAQALSAAARQYGSLEHPRIARMAEFGIAQGTTFTAVELVVGLDAMRLLAEARTAGVTLAMGGGLALVSQAARAVGYAHGRGLSHLGLAPTNLIVTADGDVKVTDFGILAATMAARPTEVPRLANRIAYMAPEQLAGEAISAATDVFVLGVIAYELVTNQRAFRGENAHQIARAVLSGPPADPPLPRPIVRVLQRCLARSPFERFPDARALADALDAALRVAPVPGTRKDIGAHVKATLDRLAAINEGQLSGVLSLNVGTGPVRGVDRPAHVPTLGRESNESMPTAEFVRPDIEVPVPSPLVGPTRTGLESPTRPDFPKGPIVTMPGVAPPPIPMPPGLGVPPPTPAGGPPSATFGMAATKRPMVPPSIPPIKPRSSPTAAPPPVPTFEPELPTFAPEDMPDPHEEPTKIGSEIPKLAHSMRQRTNNDDDLIVSIEHKDPHASATLTGDLTADRDATASERDATLSEHDASGTERNSAIAERNITRRDASDAAFAERPATFPGHQPARPTPHPGISGDHQDPEAVEPPPLLAEVWSQHQPAPIEHEPVVDAPSFEQRRTPPPIPVQPAPIPPPPGMQAGISTHGLRAQDAPRAKWPFIVIPLVVLAAAAGGAYQIWGGKADHAVVSENPGSNGSDKPGSNAIVGATPGSNAIGSNPGSNAIAHATADAALAPDAKLVATAPPDAPVSPPLDAAVQVAMAVDAGTTAIGADAGAAAVQPPASDSLAIASTPAGARVFIDGADQGVTPVKLPGSADRHTVALLLAGHELYVAEVDGHGAFQIALKPVTPAGGPAGIKVIKCKDKDRYYVSVDGKPTGMTCPTERIECEVGPHTVEVYDIVTETRRKFDIKVLDTRLSYRVRIE